MDPKSFSVSLKSRRIQPISSQDRFRHLDPRSSNHMVKQILIKYTWNKTIVTEVCWWKDFINIVITCLSVLPVFTPLSVLNLYKVCQFYKICNFCLIKCMTRKKQKTMMCRIFYSQKFADDWADISSLSINPPPKKSFLGIFSPMDAI